MLGGKVVNSASLVSIAMGAVSATAVCAPSPRSANRKGSFVAVTLTSRRHIAAPMKDVLWPIANVVASCWMAQFLQATRLVVLSAVLRFAAGTCPPPQPKLLNRRNRC